MHLLHVVPFRHACVPFGMLVASGRDLPLCSLINSSNAIPSPLPARPFSHPPFVSALPGFSPILPSLPFVSAPLFSFSPVVFFFLPSFLHPTFPPYSHARSAFSIVDERRLIHGLRLNMPRELANILVLNLA